MGRKGLAKGRESPCRRARQPFRFLLGQMNKSLGIADACASRAACGTCRREFPHASGGVHRRRAREFQGKSRPVWRRAGKSLRRERRRSSCGEFARRCGLREEMANVKNNAMAFGDRPFIKRILANDLEEEVGVGARFHNGVAKLVDRGEFADRKSTRLNSSHLVISYAV